MAFTQIDAVSALIVIDLQKGVAGMPMAHPFSEILERTARLARAFRARKLPVVLVNVSGMAPGRTDAARPNYSLPADWTELMPELEHQEDDILITKQRWGAFDGTALDGSLRGRGVTQVVMTGVATSIGVESTARCAYDLGYNVALVTDAMTDRDTEAHRYSMEKIFPRLGETATADEIIKLLTV